MLRLETMACVWLLASEHDDDESFPSFEGAFPSYAEAEKARAFMQAANDAQQGKLHFSLTSTLTFDSADSYIKRAAA